jgi:metal-sulfur cluster biosynthetic enzyme
MTPLAATSRIDSILDCLRQVPEPCSLLMRSPTNIVDMGLVESIVETEGRLHIELVLTDASCVHFSGMSTYINDVLKQIDGVNEVVVTPSRTTIWTPDRMAPAVGQQRTEG